MGYGDDNFIERDPAERTLRTLIAEDEQHVPADLIARTLDRLPAVPPTEAAHRLEVRRHRQRVAFGALLGVVLVVAGLNVWAVAGNGPQMAFMFGDGRTGVSSALLTVQLAAKPLWNTLRSISAGYIAGALVVAALSGLLLWRLVRRLQSHDKVESP